MNRSLPRILFVGPMLGRHPGWVPNPAEILAPKLIEKGYICTLTSSVVNRYLRLLDILYTLIRDRSQFDIVSIQIYSGPSFFVEDIFSFLVQLLGKKNVMVIHGGNMPVFMKQYPRWVRRVLERADVIVTPSPYLQDALAQYGFAAQVIPNMVDIKQYPYRSRKNVEPRLLWMRTFFDYCHPEFAIEVLERLLVRYPQAHLTMSGQDKGLLEPMKKLVEKKGLQRHISFAGFLNDDQKRVQFASHDIYLNTNRIDNMPVAVIEALAFGLPVVAMSVGGIPYLLTHEKTGLLTPFGNIDAMIYEICRLIEQPSLAFNLSSQGRELAEQSAWENVFPLWASVYEHLSGES